MPKRKTTRKTNSTHQDTASAAKRVLPTIGNEEMSQWNKSGFDSSVTMSNAVAEGFEHIREMHMRSAHEVHEQNDKIVRDLMHVRSQADFAQLQMEFVRFNMERAQRYWQQMFAIGNQMNAKLVEGMKSECLAAGEKISRALGQANKNVGAPKTTTPDPLRAAMDMTNMTMTNLTNAASQWMDTAKHSLGNISATRH